MDIFKYQEPITCFVWPTWIIVAHFWWSVPEMSQCVRQWLSMSKPLRSTDSNGRDQPSQNWRLTGLALNILNHQQKCGDLTFTKIQKQEIWQSKKSDVTIQTWSMLQAPAPVTWWTWNGTGSMFAAAWMVQLVQDPRPVSTKRLDIGIIQWYNIISYIYICSI